MVPSPDRVFHRMIRLERRAPDRVVAGLADDAHHFTLSLRHGEGRVLGIDGHAKRYPWNACPGATERLPEIAGMPLSPRCTAVGAHTRAREHCTHLFDLAGLAVAFAVRDESACDYHCEVRDLPSGGEEARLARNGEPHLAWTFADGCIQTPERFRGIGLRGGGFLAWAESNLDPALAEAAIVLRRASAIGRVRHFPMDRHARASDTQPVRGQCFTFQPGVAERALRAPDTRFDFSHRTDDLRQSLRASLLEEGA